MVGRRVDPREAAHRLEAWFSRHARDLPWRRTHEPYHVLVAEFILQQTRMETGLRYYDRFLHRFPTLAALGSAREAAVLAAWSGLGYYARARNLRRTARILVNRFDGQVPSDVSTLRTLPGVGPYTAGAISSIAFDRPEPALDGNQVRVLGRFLGIREPGRAAGHRRIERWSRRLLGSGSPRLLNQSLMDLGGSVCTPFRPRCDECPLAAGCRSRRRLQPRRRRLGPGRPRPIEEWIATVHRRNDRVWLAAPAPKGLLAGLWLPPLRRGRIRPLLPTLLHAFSHKIWKVQIQKGRRSPKGSGRWVSPEDLESLPHSRLTRLLLAAAQANEVGAGPRRRPHIPLGRSRV